MSDLLKEVKAELAKAKMASKLAELQKWQSINKELSRKYLELSNAIKQDRDNKSINLKLSNRDISKIKFFTDEISIKMSEVKDIQELANEVAKLKLKQEEVSKLKQSLEEYQGFEPTNEALMEKIKEMEESKGSLDFTFSDD